MIEFSLQRISIICHLVWVFIQVDYGNSRLIKLLWKMGSSLNVGLYSFWIYKGLMNLDKFGLGKGRLKGKLVSVA